MGKQLETNNALDDKQKELLAVQLLISTDGEPLEACDANRRANNPSLRENALFMECGSPRLDFAF